MEVVHLHMAINHMPLAAVIVGLGLVLYPWKKSANEFARLGYIFFVIAAFLAVATFIAGEMAADAVSKLPAISKEIVEEHGGKGKLALASAILLGLVSIFGIRKYSETSSPALWRISCILLGVITAGFFSFAAFHGGHINHPELRGTGHHHGGTENHHGAGVNSGQEGASHNVPHSH